MSHSTFSAFVLLKARTFLPSSSFLIFLLIPKKLQSVSESQLGASMLMGHFTRIAGP